MAARNLAASVSLQLPLTLRRKSQKLAQDAGVSLSSLILTALTERMRGMKERRAAHKLQRSQKSQQVQQARQLS